MEATLSKVSNKLSNKASLGKPARYVNIGVVRYVRPTTFRQNSCLFAIKQFEKKPSECIFSLVTMRTDVYNKRKPN